jgi:hypothetical protein
MAIISQTQQTLENYRKFINGASSTIYIETDGDDNGGNGSISYSFQTYQRAQLAAASMNPTNVDLQFGAGTFTFPRYVNLANFLTCKGTTSIEETVQIDSVTSSTEAAGTVFVIDRTPALTDDEWLNRTIQYSGGAGNGTYGTVTRNVGNTIYATQDQADTFFTLTASDAINLIEKETNLELTALSTITSCIQLNFNDLNIVSDNASGRVLQCLSTDKIAFTNCYTELTNLNLGRFGSAFLINSALANYGNTTNGVLVCENNSILQVGRGSHVDCETNASAGEKFMRVDADSILAIRGETVFRGLEATGVNLNGSTTILTGSENSADLFRFENASGSPSCVGGIIINTTGDGVGGNHLLPHLYGEVSSNYSVTAQRNAYVKLTSSSSLTDATGTNSVSADGGSTSSSSNDDGTKIVGGSPSFSVFPRTAFTTTEGGFSVAPGGTFHYSEIGDGFVFCYYRASNFGTSNATTYTITLPFAPAANTDIAGIGLAYDNGSLVSAGCHIELTGSSTTASLFAAPAASTAWTNSGNKRASIEFCYLRS